MTLKLLLEALFVVEGSNNTWICFYEMLCQRNRPKCSAVITLFMLNYSMIQYLGELDGRGERNVYSMRVVNGLFEFFFKLKIDILILLIGCIISIILLDHMNKK